ncbi:hypothetical protein H9X96_21915 [Pedobacter sp. N36a]|uniref:hypothetical protein n=1 Tax=Pedobacter sp. N36a TaxID=2767996 RepID=UPI001656D8AB|nr:hypothetical protein [Pedobacter sp. N36a]MBC8988416.1 hypothetical protein [Pedobacter sp. N36a]
MKKKTLMVFAVLCLLTSTFTMASSKLTQSSSINNKKICFSAALLDGSGNQIGYTFFDCDSGVAFYVYY